MQSILKILYWTLFFDLSLNKNLSMKKYLFSGVTALLFSLMIPAQNLQAQDGGSLTGDLMLNYNFFQRDSSIGAAGNQLYDNFLSGGEAWLGLRYSNYGYTGYIRMDVFNNSNLRNPTQAYSGFGIGAWNISKEYKGLTVTGGYIYDQIGAGNIFRAYEDRGLNIDNALEGLKLDYRLSDNVSIKGFTGQQKNIFDRYKPIITGLSSEGFWDLGKGVFITPGVGIVNRTLDKESMDFIVNNVNNMPDADKFIPKYNMYAFTAYNTMMAGDFTWYLEGSYKTNDQISDYIGDLIYRSGNVVFSTLSYARKGLSVTLTGKRTENFVMRTSPNQTQLEGIINYQPLVAPMRTQRVIARYSPASQDLSEMSFSGTIMATPNDEYDFNATYTHINTLDGQKLYREVWAEADIRKVENAHINVGLQYLQYNIAYYQFHPGEPMVNAITPFAEVTYRFSPKRSLIVETQYMHSKQDYGSWLYLGAELSFAPNWSFAVSDMYNIKPANPNNPDKHYYNIFTSYTKGANRFTLAYAKQVDGINCTGGVCRYEPAFSGLKLNITSTF